MRNNINNVLMYIIKDSLLLLELTVQSPWHQMFSFLAGSFAKVRDFRVQFRV